MTSRPGFEIDLPIPTQVNMFDSSDDDSGETYPPPPTLHLDFVPGPGGQAVALCGLPGARFRDLRRNLDQDLSVLQSAGIQSIVCLLTDSELRRYKVTGLLAAYAKAGFQTRRCPIEDGLIPEVGPLLELLHWMEGEIRAGRSVMVHCYGGFGRAGLVVACWRLQSSADKDPQGIIEELRAIRGPRTIQSVKQYNFIQDFLNVAMAD